MRSHLPIVLRGLAVAIAALAWLDPAVAGRGTARVAIIDTTAAGDLAARVRGTLARSFDVTTRRDLTADAWVLVTEDEEADVPDIPANLAVSVVTGTDTTRGLRLDRLDAPARLGRNQRATLTATFAGRGLAGTTSRFVARSQAIELGRVEHRWTRADERFVARFDLVPPAIGLNHIVVDVGDEPQRTHASRGDALIVVDDRPIPVLVYEGRPSWATTFVRRALEGDRRYAVAVESTVSRGIATRSHGIESDPAGSHRRLERVSARMLERFAVAIVGAPETLSATEVRALRDFVHARGGALVIVPDRQITGPIRALLPDLDFGERLLQEPIGVELAGVPGLRLFASELLEPKERRGNAAVPEVPAGGGSSSIVLMPTGNGQVLFVGALDAWRFRGRAGDGFDRWWRQVAEWLASSVPEAVSVAVDRAVVEPGSRVAVTARVRPVDDASGAASVRATHLGPLADAQRRTIVRLWPHSAPGTFGATLNAPQTPGVYAVSVEGTTGSAVASSAQAALVVAPGARIPRGHDDRWRAVTRERGGVVATVAELDRLIAALRALPLRATASPWFPLRSAWWMLPFAACLGGEWWLRRRRGLR